MREIKIFGRDVAAGEHIYDALIIGSGAAGYNAALHLYDKGAVNIAVLTENRLAGTSRNTGSDKQTYYKTACAGDQKDSPLAMAETLFAGGAMDGDIALCEAAHSLQEFFHLVSIGVDFPHNTYGEFAGYKTDHDPLQRASSIGPYTSKRMTEQLEGEVQRRKIPVIDKSRGVKLLVDKKTNRIYGVLCLEEKSGFRVYFSKNIIFAAGGNPGLYSTTVYPPGQFGSSGILASEGVRFSNITEWQYGIASLQFRWNLSGSYQQVIPRYVALDEKGGEEEFLFSYFSSVKNLGQAVFLKGYQWPFDPGRIGGEGSSLIDLAIYIEKHIRGKRIFLDYTRNPQGRAGEKFSLESIGGPAYEYLSNSHALGDSPVERLMRLNPLAYDLYKSHGIDLAKDHLEIDVVPQHHNGGAEVGVWWETSVKHLFAVGEAAGTHGVRRPGGSALNAGQVGGFRAASYIAAFYLPEDDFFDRQTLGALAEEALGEFAEEIENGTATGLSTGLSDGSSEASEAADILRRLQDMNTRNAAFIRPKDGIGESILELEKLAREKVTVPEDLSELFRMREILLLSRLMYDGILAYMKGGGKSRGSCLILDSVNNIESCAGGVETDTQHRDNIINTLYDPLHDRVMSEQRPVRPIPASDTWFERVWHEYRGGEIFR
jgi:succinate dehydrogenase/fumarate reductase flavoprotein subunit